MRENLRANLEAIQTYVSSIFNWQIALPLKIRFRAIIAYNYGNAYIPANQKSNSMQMRKALYQEYIKSSQNGIVIDFYSLTGFHPARLANVFHALAVLVSFIRIGICTLIDYIDLACQKKLSEIEKLEAKTSLPAKCIKGFFSVIWSIIEIPTYIFSSKMIGGLGDMLLLDRLGSCGTHKSQVVPMLYKLEEKTSFPNDNSPTQQPGLPAALPAVNLTLPMNPHLRNATSFLVTEMRTSRRHSQHEIELPANKVTVPPAAKKHSRRRSQSWNKEMEKMCVKKTSLYSQGAPAVTATSFPLQRETVRNKFS